MTSTSIPTNTRTWLLAHPPMDLPVLDGPNATFELKAKPLPPLSAGQVLLRTLYLSNDPAQRAWIDATMPAERMYTAPVQVGTTMHARALAEVVSSSSDSLKVGQLCTANTGWTEYAVTDAKLCRSTPELPGGLSVTHYLGALGTTGVTAWYGLMEVVGLTSADETVVVSGAAGATGSMAVQIAKRVAGCRRVVGIAGSDEKCKWVVEGLGADACVNYKSAKFEEELVAATEGYVDVYFDNVGGHVLDLMLGRMKKNGRIAACGAISGYNSTAKVEMNNYFQVITQRLQIKGFIVTDYMSRWSEAVGDLRKAVEEGKIKLGEENETVVDTKFEDVPKTWMRLFEGGNTGKLITKIV